MADDSFNLLFPGTSNSIPRIFVEYLVNRQGKGRSPGYSVGSYSKSELDPFTRYEVQIRITNLLGSLGKLQLQKLGEIGCIGSADSEEQAA